MSTCIQITNDSLTPKEDYATTGNSDQNSQATFKDPNMTDTTQELKSITRPSVCQSEVFIDSDDEVEIVDELLPIPLRDHPVIDLE